MQSVFQSGPRGNETAAAAPPAGARRPASHLISSHRLSIQLVLCRFFEGPKKGLREETKRERERAKGEEEEAQNRKVGAAATAIGTQTADERKR